MHALYRAVRQSYSKVNFDVLFLPDSLAIYFDNPAQILGDNTLLKGPQ